MVENPVTEQPDAALSQHVFRNNLPLRVRLAEVARVLGDVSSLTCLDVGADNGMMSYHLRQRGGKWSTVVATGSAEASVRSLLKDEVYVLNGEDLPFKKKVFDVVVILGGLEGIRGDDRFIEECHKVLKPDGRLVINVAHVKTWSLINTLNRVLKVGPESQGAVRHGYTESQLFGILKHGFDVLSMRSFSRFWVQLTDVATRALAARIKPGSDPENRRLRRIYFIAGIVYWISLQLDLLMFFTRGYRLIATAKRRAWRPRNAPVLVDGRSISEAVLSRAAD